MVPHPLRMRFALGSNPSVSSIVVLRRSMYVTRYAPQVWQDEVEKHMRLLGSMPSMLHPCLYHCLRRRIMVIAHVEDFLCSGPEKGLPWIRQELCKKVELQPDLLGHEERHVQDFKSI